jgi:hypothetical protein
MTQTEANRVDPVMKQPPAKKQKKEPPFLLLVMLRHFLDEVIGPSISHKHLEELRKVLKKMPYPDSCFRAGLQGDVCFYTFTDLRVLTSFLTIQEQNPKVTEAQTLLMSSADHVATTMVRGFTTFQSLIPAAAPTTWKLAAWADLCALYDSSTGTGTYGKLQKLVNLVWDYAEMLALAALAEGPPEIQAAFHNVVLRTAGLCLTMTTTATPPVRWIVGQPGSLVFVCPSPEVTSVVCNGV